MPQVSEKAFSVHVFQTESLSWKRVTEILHNVPKTITAFLQQANIPSLAETPHIIVYSTCLENKYLA